MPYFIAAVLAIAIVAALLGFGGAALFIFMGIGKILLFIFVLLFVASLVLGVGRRG